VTSIAAGPIHYDPYDVEVNLDPYPTFQRLRDEAPLYYNEEHDFWAVSRFEDCEQGLKNWPTFISGRGGILELIKAGIEMPPGILIFEDPPTHDIHRRLLSRVFTPKKMNALEGKVREFTAKALDPFVGEPGFDLIRELGAVMPMKTISMLLGIPEEHQEAVRDTVNKNLSTEAGEAMEIGDGHLEIGGDVLGDYIDWRIQHPSDDLITELLTTEFEDASGRVRTLDRDEVVTYMMVVAGAGNETTTKLIGWTGKVLAEHPDQRAEIVADRGLVPQAIEELLRFEPPAPHDGRYVEQDIELHGQVVPEGSAMLFLLGSGNRDERRFVDGHRFDIHREPKQHLTFGYGIHFCLGAALARLEGRVALDEILNRFPTWDVDLDAAKLASTSTVRGYETLPIVLP
jgi:cytochrome P450